MAVAELNSYFTKVTHGISVPQKDAMKNETLRLASYQKFPHFVPQSAIKLSSAGFFFIGKNDEVECFACGLKLKDWGPNDNPLEVHKKYSTDCPYINNNSNEYIPLASQGLNSNDKETECSEGILKSRPSRSPEVNDTSGEGYAATASSSTPTGQTYASGSHTLYPAAKPQKEPEKEAQSTVKGSLAAESGPQSFASRSNTNLKNLAKNTLPQAQVKPVNSSSQSNTTGQNSSNNLTQHTPSSQSDTSSQRSPVSNGAPVNNTTQLSQPQLESRHDYRYERSRLASFQNWPSNAAVRPEDLAKSGFYYTGTDDRVQCTFCRGILRNWEPSDEADAEHRRHFGQCPFLVSPFNVGNIPLGQENRSTQNDPDFQDYCKSIVTDRPVHQRYSLPADRLMTFKDFPTNVTQTPEMFARAGFYYSGISDQVKCFFCDGGLRNWEPNDDPWTEHARWFPRCGYLRLCKGDEFIKEVQGRYAPPSIHNKPPRLRNKNAPKHPVDKKKVAEYMKGAIVTSVLDMGYDREKVQETINRRLQDLGDDFFPNAESLYDAVVEYEEELKYMEVYGDDEENDNVDEPEVNNTNSNDKNEKSEKKKNKKKRNKKKKSSGENGSNCDTHLTFNEPLTHLDEDDAKHLAEDVQRLKDERTCKVCMDEEVNVVFLKCGHLVCCSNCAPAMRHCPICRETIRGTVRVFLS